MLIIKNILIVKKYTGGENQMREGDKIYNYYLLGLFVSVSLFFLSIVLWKPVIVDV